MSKILCQRYGFPELMGYFWSAAIAVSVIGSLRANVALMLGLKDQRDTIIDGDLGHSV